MILPNKLISFQECILAKTVHILDNINGYDFSIIELYRKVEKYFEDINEYMLALDVLYVLDKIEYDEGLQVKIYTQPSSKSQTQRRRADEQVTITVYRLCSSYGYR